MFLSEVYKRSKIVCYMACVFIFIQLFLTRKQLSTLPFLHWGMFSAMQGKPAYYTDYEIKLDGNTFDCSYMSIYSAVFLKDNIYRADAILNHQIENHLAHLVIKEKLPLFLSKSFTDRLYTKVNENPHLTKDNYKKWLKNYLHIRQGAPLADSLEVFLNYYDWDGRAFYLTKQEKVF